jgi:hypothetical protein
MEGTGTETAPFIITNVTELQAMRDDLNAHYVLGNNIDASDTVSWNGGQGFEPVGTDTDSFYGTFDGQGHTITDLYINRPSTDFVALFGCIRDGAEVKNVNLINFNITGYSDVGTLVGYSGGSTISECSSGGTVRGVESGGINSRVGGLVGRSSAASIISKCYSTANVTSGAWQVGGLSGYNGHGSIVIDCYATGSVTGRHKAGGLVGDNCYPEGGYVKRCYSTGRVTGGGGGLIGYNFHGGKTYDSYWDLETSGRSTSTGGAGKTTAEMMQQATFANWDFIDVWDIVESESYPFLRCFAYVPLEVAVDIKPGSCPNPVNTNSHGVLPVAILGSEDLDVNAIVATSVRLVDVAPIRHAYEDVSAPALDANDCNCITDGPDGHLDLTLKFKTPQIVGGLGEVNDGDILTLVLTGVLSDETPIEGADCIRVINKVPRALAAKKSDINGDGIVNIIDFSILVEYWLESTVF